MKYIVISLYTGKSSVSSELDDEAFLGLERVESESATVWRGEEYMIVQLKVAQ